MKNIAKSVCEKQLISVFGKYQELQNNDIVYKYMKRGKMKGQAFIEFESMYKKIVQVLIINFLFHFTIVLHCNEILFLNFVDKKLTVIITFTKWY